MTNTSTPLAARPDRPVDALTCRVIREIQGVAHRLGTPVFMVGAFARIILLEHVLGLHSGRATTDVDFAFALERWSEFHAIKSSLLDLPGFTASDRHAHRMYYQVPELQHPYTIDLIPFGGIEEPACTIAWPPEMAVMMNVAGFSDAYAASIQVSMAPDLVANVASLPGITVLKLFAWAERRHETSKDAIDLMMLLRCYHETGNEHRIYEDPDALAVLEAADYEPEFAGAWLLGRDVLAMASKTTLDRLDALMNAGSKDRLIQDMSRAIKGRADANGYATRLIKQFIAGLAP